MWRIFGHYISKILFLNLVGDFVTILGGLALAYGGVDWMGESPIWPKSTLLVVMMMLLLYLVDLYNFQVRRGSGELLLRVGLASLIAAVLIAAIGYALPSLRFGRMGFLSSIGLATLGLMVFRVAADHLTSHESLQKRVLVLGSGLADVIVSYEGPNGSIPFKILGFLDDDPGAYDHIPPGYDLLGKAKELIDVVEKLRPDILLVALTNMRGNFPVDAILECRFHGVRVEEWPTFYEKLTGKIYVNSLRPSWLIFSDGAVTTRLTETIKRVLDITFSLAGLILCSPLMGLAAICIKLDSPGPVFFRQERVGKNGRDFMLYKFRSMQADAERMTGPVWASEDDPRITRIGQLLRKIRFDETPQMFNVLLGNMSFIGPRPERPVFVNQLKEETPFYVLRFSVKPGITGWAQVRYQYGGTVEDAMEKLEYDLYYVKNVSVFLDLLILLNTIRVVLFRRGAR
ncbi:MAG: TIGR03013 family XrtA/PEP-CTERM system glycosyltransferase [Candidatus Entotheonellia bacterium]